MSRTDRNKRRGAQDPPPPKPASDEIHNWPKFWRDAASFWPDFNVAFGDSDAPSERYCPEQRSWSWDEGSSTRYRVSIDDDLIQWEEEAPNETSVDQPLVEFLAFGAPDDMAPPLIARDLREAIHFRDIERWPKLLTEALALCLQQPQRSAASGEHTYKRTGSTSWEWGYEADGYTAILAGNQISWLWHGPKDMGNSIQQSVVDFVAFGPDEKTAPDGLPWEIFHAIRERDFKGWTTLLAQARTLSGDIEIKQHPDYVSHGTWWEWGDKYDRYSASLGENQIRWAWKGPKDLGGGSEQSFEEFLSKGPLDDRAPAGVVREIHEAVLAWRGNPMPPQPPSSWGNMRAAATADAKAIPEPDADEVTLTPLGRLLVQGLVVVVVSVAIGGALASTLPTLAKYVSIILPVLLGFFAAFRWGSMSLIVAGFFALAGSLGSQIAVERYFELNRGTVVTLASIAEAPRHLEATRFIVADVRTMPAYVGNVQRTVTQRPGAGPSPRVLSIWAVPLVPTGWTRDRPVPAWLACTTTPGFDCLRASERDATRTIRVPDNDIGYYREAIADAKRRHGITSANDAPILEGTADPIGVPDFYLAGAIALPLIAFGVWALGIVGWRLRRKRRRVRAGST